MPVTREDISNKGGLSMGEIYGNEYGGCGKGYGSLFTSTGVILVLFILLVIVLRTF